MDYPRLVKYINIINNSKKYKYLDSSSLDIYNFLIELVSEKRFSDGEKLVCLCPGYKPEKILKDNRIAFDFISIYDDFKDFKPSEKFKNMDIDFTMIFFTPKVGFPYYKLENYYFCLGKMNLISTFSMGKFHVLEIDLEVENFNPFDEVDFLEYGLDKQYIIMDSKNRKYPINFQSNLYIENMSYGSKICKFYPVSLPKNERKKHSKNYKSIEVDINFFNFISEKSSGLNIKDFSKFKKESYIISLELIKECFSSEEEKINFYKLLDNTYEELYGKKIGILEFYEKVKVDKPVKDELKIWKERTTAKILDCCSKVKDYTKNFDVILNYQLRKNTMVDFSIPQFSAIYRAMNSIDYVPKGRYIYRGLALENLSDLKTFEKGFSSFSFSLLRSFWFATTSKPKISVIIYYELEEKDTGIYLNKLEGTSFYSEEELLLPCGMKYEIIKTDIINNIYFYKIRFVESESIYVTIDRSLEKIDSLYENEGFYFIFSNKSNEEPITFKFDKDLLTPLQNGKLKIIKENLIAETLKIKSKEDKYILDGKDFIGFMKGYYKILPFSKKILEKYLEDEYLYKNFEQFFIEDVLPTLKF